MDKRGEATYLGILLAIALIFSIMFTFLSFYFPQKNPGISGAAITDNLVNTYLDLSLTTKIVIASEWLIVLTIIFLILMKGKLIFNKDIGDIKPIQDEKNRYKKSRSQTDLDVLYEMLKKRKKIRVSVISKLFDIKESIAINWGESLESAGLAELRYPTVGDPKLILKQDFEEEDE